MKIFISWSGDTSRELAQALKNWLPTVLQAVKPYFTPQDIDKGSKWQGDILQSLNESSIGIICLTPDNLEKPWILFEAGALSNRLENAKVCPLLFDVSKANVKGPLSIFQLTEFIKEDFKKLIQSINNQLGELKVLDDVFEMTFEAFYPKFSEQVNTIISNNTSAETGNVIVRTDRDLLEEVLELMRRQSQQQNFESIKSKVYKSFKINSTDQKLTNYYNSLSEDSKKSFITTLEKMYDKDTTQYNIIINHDFEDHNDAHNNNKAAN